MPQRWARGSGMHGDAAAMAEKLLASFPSARMRWWGLRLGPACQRHPHAHKQGRFLRAGPHEPPESTRTAIFLRATRQ